MGHGAAEAKKGMGSKNVGLTEGWGLPSRKLTRLPMDDLLVFFIFMFLPFFIFLYFYFSSSYPRNFSGGHPPA